MIDNQPSPYSTILNAADHNIQEAAGLIRGILTHSGEIGGQVERVFHQALRRVLPERVGVTSGFVVDSEGRVSQQLDIILYDRFGAPSLFANGDFSVLPAECTYAAGEVKTRLDQAAFHDAFAKCASYKSLDRSAQYTNEGVVQTCYNLYGVEEAFWPPIFFLLAIESAQQATFHTQAKNALTESKANFRDKIDVACCLDGNFKCNANMVPCLDNPADRIVPQRVSLCSKPDQTWCTYPSARPWSFFVSLLNTVMTQTPRTNVNMLKYMGNQTF